MGPNQRAAFAADGEHERAAWGSARAAAAASGRLPTMSRMTS